MFSATLPIEKNQTTTFLFIPPKTYREEPQFVQG